MDNDTQQRGAGAGRKATFEELLNESFATQRSAEIGAKLVAKVFNIGREYVALDLGTREEGLLPREEVTTDGAVTVAVGDTLTIYTVALRDGAVLCSRRLGTAAHAEAAGDKDAAIAAIQDAAEQGLAVEGTVKEVVKSGFSVHVLGLRAFCPISQISDTFCEQPEEHLGHTYPFAVLEIDSSGRKFVVSRRRLLEAEAEERAVEVWQTLNVGDVRDGTVKSVKSYGVFVDIGGVEGLLHVSEIDHDRVDDPATRYAPGQAIRVQIKGIDPERKRVSLSAKSLLEDPWVGAQVDIVEGAVLTGEVVRLAPFGAFVELKKGVEGLVHISEMGAGRRLRSPREVTKEGAVVEVRVLTVDLERRRIALSMDSAGDGSAAAGDEGREGRDGREGREGGEGRDERPAREPARPAPKQSLGTFADLFRDKLKK
jgi:small subunit ribosomal protein S1